MVPEFENFKYYIIFSSEFYFNFYNKNLREKI